MNTIVDNYEDKQLKVGDVIGHGHGHGHGANQSTGNAAKKRKTGCGRFIARVLISHVGLLILVLSYDIAGAYLFREIECHNENNKLRLKDIAAVNISDRRQYLVDQISNTSQQNGSNTFDKLLKTFTEEIVNASRDFGYDGSNPKNTDINGTIDYGCPKWHISSAFLFTTTILTTIGYGNVTPKTSLGQMVVILYALIAVPLMTMFLSNVGISLGHALQFIYNRICCIGNKRKPTVDPDQPGQYKNHEVENAPINRPVPLPVTILVMALYLTMGTIIYKYWMDDWTYYTSLYFCFVTLTTIGFGDYTPVGGEINGEETLTQRQKVRIAVSAVYIVIGLAVLAMGIDLALLAIKKQARTLKTKVEQKKKLQHADTNVASPQESSQKAM